MKLKVQKYHSDKQGLYQLSIWFLVKGFLAYMVLNSYDSHPWSLLFYVVSDNNFFFPLQWIMSDNKFLFDFLIFTNYYT